MPLSGMDLLSARYMAVPDRGIIYWLLINQLFRQKLGFMSCMIQFLVRFITERNSAFFFFHRQQFL